MIDTGLRLSEVARLTSDDANEEGTLRVVAKWCTVALGTTSATAVNRWTQLRTPGSNSLWSGRKGALSTEGIYKVVERRGRQAGLHLHAHMLRHTFEVENQVVELV